MKILYVEDELAHVELTQRTLEDNLQDKFVLYHVDSFRGAMKMLGMEPDIDLVLTDLRLPDGSGLDLLRMVKDRQPAPAVVLVTGQGDESVAVTALKSGAADYLVKEGDYLHRLPAAITNAVAQNRLAREQAALRAVENRFRVLVEQIPAAVYTSKHDENSTRLYISPQIKDIVGYTAEEWLAEPDFWLKHIHPEDISLLLSKIQETHRSLGDFTLDYRLFHRSGATVWVRDFARIIHDDDGQPRYWQGILFDITGEMEAQSAIQAERDFALQVLNNMGQGLTVLNEDELFEYVNPAYANMLGLQPEDLLGKSPNEFTTQESKKRLNDEGERRRRGETSSYENRLIHNDGHEVPVVITGVPRRQNDRINGTISVITDLTQQKQTEQALERQVRELTVLHAVATAEAESTSEDETIARVTNILSQIYSEVCGILLIDPSGQFLTPHPSYAGADISGWQAGYPLTEGITGRSALSGRTIRIGDVTREPGYIEIASDIRSELCVPISMHGRIIGVINVESHTTDQFTEHDENYLSTIANGLGTALERLRLFAEEQRRAEELNQLYQSEQKRRQNAEILREATLTLTYATNTQAIYSLVLETLSRLFKYDSASIELIDEGYLTIAASQGLPNSEKFAQLRYPFKMEKWGTPADLRRPIIIDNVQNDPRFEKFEETTYIRSWMGIPLFANERLIGFVNLDSRLDGYFKPEDAEVAQTFGNHAATALENTRLYEAERRRTRIVEVMAGIANRIATTREIMPVLDEITSSTLELLKANHVAIYILHDDNQTIKAVTAQGEHRMQLLNRTIKIGEGITGSVVASGKPEIIKNMSDDARRVFIPGTPMDDSEYETMISSPLILLGKPIGAINAWRRIMDGVFNQTELDFLVGIAHQASIAIESARLFQETTRRGQEAAAIAEVGRDISSTLQLDTVLLRIAEYARDLLSAESSAVYIVDESRPTLRAIAAVGLDAQAIKDDPIEMGTGILGSIAQSKVGEIVNFTVNDPRMIIIRDTNTSPNEHIMGVPVLSKDALTGLLVVWREGAELQFLPGDLEFLNSLAQQAATAIENARLYNEAQLRLKDLEVINQISTLLRSTPSLEQMLPAFLDETMRLLQSENGSLWLFDSTRGELVQRTARGLPTQFKVKALKPSEGIIGHVFTHGTAYVSEEFVSDPLIFQGNLGQTPPGLGGICVPIQSTAGTVGVILIELEAKRQSAGQAGLLTTLAEIAGNAIYRAELFEQGQEQIRRLTALRDIDSAISSSTDLRVTLKILMDHTVKHLKVDAVDILLYHPELQSLTYLTSTGFINPSPSRPLMRLGEGLAGQVVMKGGSAFIQNLQADPEIRRDPILAREGFVSYYGVPLLVKGQVKGVFEIFQRSPFTPTDDWVQFLQTLAGQAAIAIDNAQLFDNLQRSNQEIRQAYDTTLEGWARALELRDRETEGHTRRVTNLTMQLARYMDFPEDELVNVYRGVLLHDIGKMGVPDQILRKTGPLNETEWYEMRKHPEYAFNLLAPIPYLRPALDIPYCHHEHWDGSGYPRGLRGEQIPLAARIFSIVDIWDALLSDRPYRKAWPREKVVEYLKEISGKILDPQVVTVFLNMIEETQPRDE